MLIKLISCGAKMLIEVRQPLSDVIDLYCRNISESQMTDSVDFLPTATAAVVTDVMSAVQRVRSPVTHTTPILKCLNWLKINQRIRFFLLHIKFLLLLNLAISKI